MGRVKDQLSRLSKDGLPGESQYNRQRPIVLEDSFSRISCLQESLAWEYDAVLTGVSIKVAGDTWQMVIKVERGPRSEYAKVQATSLNYVVEVAHDLARRGALTWRPDSHPVRVSKRSGIFSS